MFNIGFSEMLIILVVALVVLGPSKLPEVAKSLGRGYAEFIRSVRGIREEVDKATMDLEEEKKIFSDPAAMAESLMDSTFPEEKKTQHDSQEPKIAPENYEKDEGGSRV